MISININDQSSSLEKKKVIIEVLQKILRQDDIICSWKEKQILIQLFQVGKQETRSIKRRIIQNLPDWLLSSLTIKFSIVNYSDECILEERVQRALN